MMVAEVRPCHIRVAEANGVEAVYSHSSTTSLESQSTGNSQVNRIPFGIDVAVNELGGSGVYESELPDIPEPGVE